ncbi:MAG: hypothetical protein LBV04_09925, partial [Deferribacteraceae bacterium]|nr:hypothetical protein [Deferribacteraceae bacterium]
IKRKLGEEINFKNDHLTFICCHISSLFWRFSWYYKRIQKNLKNAIFVLLRKTVTLFNVINKLQLQVLRK